MRQSLVTIKQAQELKALGFRDKVSTAMNVKTGNIYPSISMNHNRMPHWVSIPTVDEVIDWFRRKHDVIIYNTRAPFVDPTDSKSRISYAFSIKFCSKRDGWNGRIHVGYSGCSYNIYAAKRRAISIAISWLKQQNKRKPKRL